MFKLQKELVVREAHRIPIVGLQNSWLVNYHYAGRNLGLAVGDVV